MRKQGFSQSMIREQLDVPKSTLSNWLHGVPFTFSDAAIARIKAGPAKSALQRHQRKVSETVDIHHAAKQDVGMLSPRDLFILGIALYLGEGAKTNDAVRFVNSDPATIQLAMRWFREACHVPDENFRMILHGYPDTDIKKANRYWSKITGIPVRQFLPPQIDRREGKSLYRAGKLPFGTAHISVYRCKDSEFGVKFHRKIMGWIYAVQQSAGVI